MAERRRASGTTSVSPDCPKCHGKKTIPLGIVAAAAPCDACGGTGKVTLEKAGELFGLEPITRRDTPSARPAIDLHTTPEEMSAVDTDPCPPPSASRDPRREPE